MIGACSKVSIVSFVVIGCLYYTCLTVWLVNQIVEHLHTLLIGDYSIAHCDLIHLDIPLEAVLSTNQGIKSTGLLLK